jgi:hypothetical protein
MLQPYVLQPEEILTADVIALFLPPSETLRVPYAIHPIRFTLFLNTYNPDVLPPWLRVDPDSGHVTAAVDLQAHTLVLILGAAVETQEPSSTDLFMREITTFYYNTKEFHVSVQGGPAEKRVSLDKHWSQIPYAILPNSTTMEVTDTAWKRHMCAITTKPVKTGEVLTMTR